MKNTFPSDIRRGAWAAGGLRSEFVRQGDARRPLQTLDQLSRLSLALAPVFQ